ncbi:hypothetical protein [Methylocella sp.]|uniref:hypothetical protein n=1 Tax=Methylocella sp. TaxID=1978226 RepID=UPI0035B43049
MAVPDSGDFWPNLFSGGVGAALGALGTVVVAVLNRQPAMASLVDARIRTLIESYERHVGDLQRQIRQLESKVDMLTRALEEAGDRR